jgi:hypothetical protein
MDTMHLIVVPDPDIPHHGTLSYQDGIVPCAIGRNSISLIKEEGRRNYACRQLLAGPRGVPTRPRHHYCERTADSAPRPRRWLV